MNLSRPGTKQQAAADHITERIASGLWREGHRLPSEEKLALEYGVSLGTMQKALAHLARAGILSREHGRGTFVAGSKLLPADVRFLRFKDQRGHVLPLFVKVLKVARLRSTGVWSRFLGERECVRIDRLFEAGPRVRLASEFYLRARDYTALKGSGKDDGTAPETAIGRGSRRAMSADNLRELLAQRLSLPTVKVEQLIKLAPPSAWSARILGLDSSAPAFSMELFGHTVNNRPLYYQRISGGAFRDSLVITRDGNAESASEGSRA